ncbi:MAG: OPT/YSL family transporter, partial [Myxococcota bacterium]|nr:OPT/YSL family transporter [Myxococcota bacterium]
MEHGTPKASKLLPSNAYTKLAPGEVYRPIVSAGDRRAEVTLWSVSFGLLMVVVFSAACIYIALRAGNGIEAAIPIAILAIFFGKLRKVRSTILENVIVQSIGQASGVVAAGAAFLIPALYINRLEVAWWHIFLATFVGGVLGVVLIIPLRKYFVKDLHGDLPFPEGTAINEVLVTGESAGKSSGKILLASFGLGAIYDFLVEGVHAWNPTLTTKTLMGRAGEALSNLRIDLSLNGIAALFGLGYIIGLRYAAIIAAGSILSTVVLVPMVYLVGAHAGELSFAGKTLNIGTMSSGAIFAEFVRPIGIGAIAASAIIGIIRMGKIILSSVSLGFKGLRGGAANIDVERTQRDLHPRNVLLIQAVSVVQMALVFFIVAMVEAGDTYSTAQCLMFALVGAGVGFIFSFR